jgi:hypothetical protein
MNLAEMFACFDAPNPTIHTATGAFQHDIA